MSGYGGSAAGGSFLGGFAGQSGQDVRADGPGGPAVGGYGERRDPGVHRESALVGGDQVGAGEPRAARGVPDLEVDDLGGSEPLAGPGVLGGAAAQGQDERGASQQVGDDLVLEGTEGRLAVLGEDLRDRAAGPLLDDLVAVGERESQALGEQLPDGGLAGAHEADQDDPGPACPSCPARLAP